VKDLGKGSFLINKVILEKRNRRMFKLMIKMHLTTKLKYLCYTTKKDPYKYTGSGVRWLRHLDVHGHNIVTCVIGEYDTHDKLVEAGLAYSALYNVVESEKWANLRPEDGLGQSKGYRWKVKDSSNMGRHKNQWKNDDGTRSVKTSQRMKDHNPSYDINVRARAAATKKNSGVVKGANNPSSFPVMAIGHDGTCFIFPYCRLMCNVLKFPSSEVSLYLNDERKRSKQLEMIQKQIDGSKRIPTLRGYYIERV
jgi:hypothetical protein